MDWKELLKKYMRHVINEEGIDFVAKGRIEFQTIGLSPQERDALLKISDEIDHDA